jgi:hypothetical protein
LKVRRAPLRCVWIIHCILLWNNFETCPDGHLFIHVVQHKDIRKYLHLISVSTNKCIESVRLVFFNTQSIRCKIILDCDVISLTECSSVTIHFCSVYFTHHRIVHLPVIYLLHKGILNTVLQHCCLYLKIRGCCCWGNCKQDCTVIYRKYFICFSTPLWSSGQSFWLQIQISRVRFPAIPDCSGW